MGEDRDMWILKREKVNLIKLPMPYFAFRLEIVAINRNRCVSATQFFVILPLSPSSLITKAVMRPCAESNSKTSKSMFNRPPLDLGPN